MHAAQGAHHGQGQAGRHQSYASTGEGEEGEGLTRGNGSIFLFQNDGFDFVMSM